MQTYELPSNGEAADAAECEEKMILTVSLNPAVDKTCGIESVQPGTVNRLKSVVSVAGGKGINVTKILRQFHMPVAAVGFLGGAGGKLIEEAMEELGVECHFTRIKGQTRTNVNILAEDGSVTELLEPGPVIREKELEEFRKQFSGCLELSEIAVLSGSVPEGVPADIYRQLIEECHRNGVKVILDTSGEALRAGILAKPDLLKPNLKELESLLGKKLDSPKLFAEETTRLCEQGVGKLIVSLGAEGLFYMDENQDFYQAAKKVKAVNTVGCGDTVVASLCMSELSGDDPETALQKAAALAAANASTMENGQIPMKTYLDLL